MLGVLILQCSNRLFGLQSGLSAPRGAQAVGQSALDFTRSSGPAPPVRGANETESLWIGGLATSPYV
jgi:hypothetical protein